MKPSNVAVRRERREERYNVNYKAVRSIRLVYEAW